MLIVRETAPGAFDLVYGNPTLDSRDGERRAPLATILADSWTDEERAGFGVYLVDETPPAGHRWTGELALVAGTPAAVFVALGLEELKAVRRADVKARQEALFLAGWTYDFAAAGTHTLDLRNADDKSNWTLLLIKTQGMVAAGAGAMPVEIRTASNVKIAVPAAEANAALLEFLAWGEAMLKAKWDLDDAIEAAVDEAALAVIDVGAGWP